MIDRIVYFVLAPALFVFFLVPTFVFSDMAIGNNTPETVHYNLWLAGINVFDVFFCGISYLAMRVIRVTPRMAVLLGLMICMFTWGNYLQFLNSNGVYYIDGIVYFVRSIYALILGVWVTQKTRLHDVMRVITLAVATNALVAIVNVVFDYKAAALAGRINLMGFGPNGSAEIAFFCTFFILFVDRKWALWKRLIVCGVLVLYIPLSGGRRMIVAVFGLILLRFKSRRYALINMLMVIVFSFAVMVLLLNIEIIGLTFEGTNFSAISRLADSISQLQHGTFQDGRQGMYEGGLSVIDQFPFGLGLSDWRIQEELSRFAVGSHTHNVFLQFYLKYGVVGILFLAVVLFWGLQFVWGKEIEWRFLTIVVLVSMMTGYGFWNQKMNFFYFFVLGSLVNFPFPQRPRRLT